MAHFDFVVIGVPRTPQTKRSKTRNLWKQAVRSAAAKAWIHAFPIDAAEVSVAIVYFYRETTDIDVDGIGKLIVDSLIGLAIPDDGIVSQVVLRKTNQAMVDYFDNAPSALGDVFGIERDFVYVLMSGPPDHRSLPG